MCVQPNTGYDRNNIFANSILATHVGGLWDALVSRDRWVEKLWLKTMYTKLFVFCLNAVIAGLS